MGVDVVSAAQASARDQATILAGTPSRELMRRAGERAAHCISTRFGSACDQGVLVLVGTGNNGGDGWVVAGELQRMGFPVSVEAVGEPVTPDAKWAQSTVALPFPVLGADPGIVVDALLGTGASGAPRGPVAALIERAHSARARGALVVAIDMPTGLDASTGAAALAVHADLTITFGNWKKGHLARRDLCGELVALDIGLAAGANDHAPGAVDVEWVRQGLPAIAVTAHKGDRRRILIVGGNVGMAGACILAARGALRSGVGMVRCCVHPASLVPVQVAVPEATALRWPEGPDFLTEGDLAWPHAVLIGPGFGLDPGARSRLEGWLTRWKGPVVLDADALTLFAGDATGLGRFLAGRPAVVTPHAVEAARLRACSPAEVSADPYAVAVDLAFKLQATVLLKGVPTHVADQRGRRLVVPRGTQVLATGGSGDVLAGIVTTLLAQTGDATVAAGAGAWVHGRAAEIANAGSQVRGVTLADVLDSMAHAWHLVDSPLGEYELARLPAIGGHA